MSFLSQTLITQLDDPMTNGLQAGHVKVDSGNFLGQIGQVELLFDPESKITLPSPKPKYGLEIVIVNYAGIHTG